MTLWVTFGAVSRVLALGGGGWLLIVLFFCYSAGMIHGESENPPFREQVQEQVEINESLLPVVDRMSQYVPVEELRQWFTSEPQETGGVRRYPYCRVDSELLVCRDRIRLTNLPQMIGGQKIIHYSQASNHAMLAVLWVEIGFQGLENLAKSPASKNWTSGVGHFVSAEEREAGILSGGKDLYESVLREFVRLRKVQGVTDDCFTEYHLEHLLQKWE